MEEQIKQSLFQEVTSLSSPFKNIKIDQETMDVKRLLDHDMLKTASFMREIDVSDISLSLGCVTVMTVELYN